MCTSAVACGGDDPNGEPASTPSGASASAGKAPIKIMAQAAVDTQLQSYPEVFAGAQAAAHAINEQGGIQGHPVELLECNSQANANGSRACSRRAISEEAVAVIAPTEVFAHAGLPVLSRAGVPYVGNGGVPIEQQDEGSFPIGNGPYSFGGGVIYAKNEGIENIGITTVQTAAGAAVVEQLESFSKEVGLTVTGPILFPPTTTNFGPIVQQLRGGGAEAVLAITGGPITPSLEQAAQQIGYKPTWITGAVNIGAQLESAGAALEGTVVSSTFPPTTADLPGIEKFNQDVDAAEEAGVVESITRNDTMLTAWSGVYALATVAEEMIDGDVTAETMKEALGRAEGIDVNGLLTWSPGTSGPSNTPRVTNGNVYMSVIRGGEYELLSPDPVDIFQEAGLVP